MRTIVVGDIHGCYEELLQLLNKIQLRHEDCLISLGDIVDRGADSVKVYDFLKNRPNTIVLMGNHERKHLRNTLSYSQEIVKLQFGDRYEEFLEWASHLPYYYETPEAILVHAAVEDGKPIKEQAEEVLCGCTAGEKYLNKRYGNIYWTKLYKGEKPVIFGHHVVGASPLIVEGKIYGIDTGACHGARLTGLILPSFETFQVQSSKDYWQEELVKWQLPVMVAKPWKSYKWDKIKAICNDFKDSRHPELTAFLVKKERWMNNLLSNAPKIILKVEEKLAELIEINGADNFKKQARKYSYAPLLYKANSSGITSDFLKQTLRSPYEWLQVMEELGIDGGDGETRRQGDKGMKR